MVLISAYLVIAPIYEAPLESLFCVLFLLSGIPLYLIFVRYEKVPVNFLRFVGKFVYVSYYSQFSATTEEEKRASWQKK